MPISQVPFAGISNPVDFRNIVINGDMQIAQRSTSVASITTIGIYTVDRFKTIISSLGTWTNSQSTDVPTGQGFANSFKLDCTTADAAPAAGDYMVLSQIFEGQNLQYLKKGTANASPLTASFWVKSTKTGTFILELNDLNNSRSISKSYTVSVSNTWEFKTITYAGDTTGAFTNNNGASLGLNFWLGAGSDFTSGTLATSWASTTSANRAVGQVNIADNTANDFLITGVQLEAGEQASGFEFMPYDIDLGRCNRYYQTLEYANGSMLAVGSCSGTAATAAIIDFNKMRVAPTVTLPATGSGSGQITFLNSSGAGYPSTIGTIAVSGASINNFLISGSGYTGAFIAGATSQLYNTGAVSIKMDSEL